MAGGAGRSKVDGLRRERLLFDDVLRKSDRQWREQRGEMVSLIQETTDANEQRSKVCAARSQAWYLLLACNPWHIGPTARHAIFVTQSLSVQPAWNWQQL